MTDRGAPGLVRWACRFLGVKMACPTRKDAIAETIPVIAATMPSTAALTARTRDRCRVAVRVARIEPVWRSLVLK